jgi:hypothetical protein
MFACVPCNWHIQIVLACAAARDVFVVVLLSAQVVAGRASRRSLTRAAVAPCATTLSPPGGYQMVRRRYCWRYRAPPTASLQLHHAGAWATRRCRCYGYRCASAADRSPPPPPYSQPPPPVARTASHENYYYAKLWQKRQKPQNKFTGASVSHE